MPKVTLQEMLKSCMVQIVAAYEKLSEEKQMKVGVCFPLKTKINLSFFLGVSSARQDSGVQDL